LLWKTVQDRVMLKSYLTGLTMRFLNKINFL